VPDTQIHPTGTENVPADYLIQKSAEILLKGVYASFDGSGAGGDFLPLLRIISNAGSVVLEAVSDTTVAAGGSADVSWFPHLAAAAPVSSGLTSLPLAWAHSSSVVTSPAGGSVSFPWDDVQITEPAVYSWSGLDASAIHLKADGSYACVFMYGPDTDWPATAAGYIQATGSVTGAGNFTNDTLVQFASHPEIDLFARPGFQNLGGFLATFPIVFAPSTLRINLANTTAANFDTTPAAWMIVARLGDAVSI
jgi:hypothetical protein